MQASVYVPRADTGERDEYIRGDAILERYTYLLRISVFEERV